MTSSQLAKQKDVTPGYISQIKNGLLFTTNYRLALEVSKLSGKLPIEHISPRVREAYAKAYPELLVAIPSKEAKPPANRKGKESHDKEAD